MRANYNSYTDAELIELLIERDMGAFETIYERYWALLYIHAKKMLHDEDQAKDIVQELFINLLSKTSRLNVKTTLRSLLYSSTRNLVITHIRREKMISNYTADVLKYAKEGEFTTDNHIREKELQTIIEYEVEKLPTKMRAIFEMSKKAYLDNRQIAKATNTTEENVRKQLRHAVTRIRSKFTCFICLQIMTTIIWMNK